MTSCSKSGMAEERSRAIHGSRFKKSWGVAAAFSFTSGARGGIAAATAQSPSNEKRRPSIDIGAAFRPARREALWEDF